MQDVTDAPQWLQRKERGSMLLLRFMTWLSLLLGRRLTRVVVYGIALYFVLAVPAARRASRQYLQRCLPRPVGWLDIYRHVLTFASTVHDRVYLLNDRFGLFDVRMHGERPGAMDAAASGVADDGAPPRAKGAFLFGAHLGSFEVLRTCARRDVQGQVCIAMYPENARQINQALAAINPNAVQDIIALGQVDAILTIHDRIESGAMVGILADRAIHSDRLKTLPFLGQPASFPQGPFRLAVAMRQPVYFMTGLYAGSGRYELHFELLSDGDSPRGERAKAVEELMQKYVHTLERHCRSAPYNWFNFYDFWESDRHGRT